MAFTGTPVVQKVTDKLFRITGVSLAAAASGVVAVRPGPTGTTTTGAIVLVAPDWKPYEFDGALISLDASVDVTMKAAGTSVTTSVPTSVVKSLVTQGDGTIELEATCTNNLASGSPTNTLEIYVEWKGH